jgi:hypothetical protein
MILAMLLAAAVAPGAMAQGHKHAETGPHGGPMQDVVGVHAELVVSDKTVTVYLYDEANKPVSANGYGGSVLAGAGQARQVIALTAGADNSLAGTGTATIGKPAGLTLQLRNPAGKSGQARY